MGKDKILVKADSSKYVVGIDKKLIKIEDCKPNLRVALRSGSY